MVYVRELDYRHPYRWQTIGKERAILKNATMEDVKAILFQNFFFFFFTAPLMYPGGSGQCNGGSAVARWRKKWFAIPCRREIQIVPSFSVDRTKKKPLPPAGSTSNKQKCLCALLQNVASGHRLADGTMPRAASELLSGGGLPLYQGAWVNEQPSGQ